MFKKLFSKTPALEPPQAPPLALQAVIQKQLCPQGLQPLPKNARIAFEVSTNSSTEAKDIIHVIQSDEAFTAKILKVGNSAYFNRGNKITSVKDAVHLIGLSEVCSMLSCSSLNDIFPSTSTLRTACWKHNVSTAIIARTLSQELRLGKAGSFFTAGLLHDVGKLAFIQRFPKEYTEITNRALKDGTPISLCEKDLFPFDHCEVGATIAGKWNFAEEVTAAIVGHHALWEQIHQNVLTKTVKLADLVSHRICPEWEEKSDSLKTKLQEDLSIGWSKFSVFPKRAEELLRLLGKKLEDELEIYS
jgi:putative nucleotidyltransferase with HDIG domain